jgi:transcriptional regulator NrdR family protein
MSQDQTRMLNSRKTKELKAPKKRRAALTITHRYFELMRLREMLRAEISQRGLRVS